MRKSTICMASIMYAITLHAQNNVGINTTSPQATLDVRGSQRFGGATNYMKYDSATGRIEWIGAALYAPVSQQIIRHSNSTEGLYAGGGRLEYRNTLEPVFYSDWTNGNGYFKNNLGISSITPFAPLTFANANGPKIALSGTASSNHGFSVQNDILQVYSMPSPGSAIAFGSYSNSTFDEIMRIQTTRARVGIGTSDPRGMLHLSNGSSGLNPAASSTLILESNSSAYMNLLSPTAAESGILFGNGTNSASGSIIFGNSYTPNGFQFRNNGNTTQMVLDFAGRLGLGTVNPAVKLHLSGGPSGGTPFVGAQLGVENLGNTYINVLSPDANETGILFGKSSNSVSGGIVYNNSATLNGLQFRNNGNVTKMVLDDQGRLGIGNLSPNAPLSFPPALGKKITLYPGTTGDVGLSVQGNLLQIYSDNPNADIAFGYDQAGVMTERMRIKANGNVGIGTNNPQFPLDINGGIALTGAISLNGHQGTIAQTIQSNGPGSAPAWASSTNVLYQNTFQVYSAVTGVIAITAGNSALVPGMTSTFNLMENSKIMVQFNVSARTSCVNCFGNVYIEIICDGNHLRTFEWRIMENSSLTLSASHLLTLFPGSHTISLLASAESVTVNFGFSSSANFANLDTMILQIIPQ